MLTLCQGKGCNEVIKPGPEPKSRASHGWCMPCMRAWMSDNGCSQEDIDEVVKQVNETRWDKIWK